MAITDDQTFTDMTLKVAGQGTARSLFSSTQPSGIFEFKIISYCILQASGFGYVAAQLVEALRYKPEGRGFDSPWSHWNFSVI
jgi:hypothetical protein